MSTKFYPLRVKTIEKVTADCSVLSLEVPETAREAFAFRQGQHLTLRATINGEEVRRSYSLCSSPLEEEWKVAVKKVVDGRFSSYANEVLKAGDELEVMRPSGRFYVPTDPGQQKNYVAFAAGSGITPIISIIKTHLRLEPKSTFTLFYVNRTAASIILKEELEDLKNQYLDRFELFYFLTQEKRSIPLFNGRIDAEKLDIIFKTLLDRDSIDDYFICGPAPMIFLIRDYLEQMGCEKKQIHFELFNTDGLLPNGKAHRKQQQNKEGQTEVSIREGGKYFNFKMAKGANSILDAALQRQADLPFACKGGVCCTCRAKLLEGEVEVLVNYGLEEDEIENGYILTCQAVPMSDKVVVDFDG